ncbi:MAG: LemA family protein [Candidatus Eisenbacteria bacterium]|nr:LemA family protein [Candidatus Eisenbacteria bacterium]
MKNLPLWIILAVVVIAVLAGFGQYNNLVSLDQSVQGQWAQVNSVLLRRNDLIPNLVATVKGVAGQEQKVFGDIADARARMSGAASRPVGEQIDAARQMDSAIGRLLVVVENYPQLRSAENFSSLQAQLEGSENRIAVERRRYNELVQSFNITVKRFPGMIFANLFGFKEKPFYPVAEEAKKVPQVNF